MESPSSGLHQFISHIMLNILIPKRTKYIMKLKERGSISGRERERKKRDKDERKRESEKERGKE